MEVDAGYCHGNTDAVQREERFVERASDRANGMDYKKHKGDKSRKAALIRQ
jgi:hypothetical protein